MPKTPEGWGSNPRNGAKADAIARANRMDSRRGPQGHVGLHAPNRNVYQFPHTGLAFGTGAETRGSSLANAAAKRVENVKTTAGFGGGWLTGRKPLSGPTPPVRIPEKP